MSMQVVTEFFRIGFSGFFEKYGDKRLKDRFLLQTPGPVLCILAVYLLFCLKLGPMLMKNRKPFDLKKILIVYNFSVVIGSCWLLYQSIAAGCLNYSFTCELVDYSDNPNAVKMAKASHWYFIFKVIELLDTVFFVLRKKSSQISFLHVYHHSFMCLLAWTIAKFYAGGHTSIPASINTLVHVVMYSYYFLAAFGPKFQKYLWWKKYLTKLQLVQFVIMIGHQSQVLFNGCPTPKFVSNVCIFHAFFFFYLFLDFYFFTYTKKSKKK